jgi:hypothetical protein
VTNVKLAQIESQFEKVLRRISVTFIEKVEQIEGKIEKIISLCDAFTTLTRTVSGESQPVKHLPIFVAKVRHNGEEH